MQEVLVLLGEWRRLDDVNKHPSPPLPFGGCDNVGRVDRQSDQLRDELTRLVCRVKVDRVTGRRQGTVVDAVHR